jgi:hypothetical protein
MAQGQSVPPAPTFRVNPTLVFLDVTVLDKSGHPVVSGLTKAENAAGQSFGEAALPTTIRENQDLDAEQLVDMLLKEMLVWSRDGMRRQQEDDITMLIIDS